MAGGYRSLAAFWMGGAGVAPAGGFRSLLAFWAGGAVAESTTPPPTDTGGGITRFRDRVDPPAEPRRLQLIAEITYYDIDAEIIEELCRLGIDCCTGLGGGVIPPPTSGTSGTGSQALEDCEHAWSVSGDDGDDCDSSHDSSIVPRWFLQEFVDWVANLPPPLRVPLAPIVALVSACLSNPANVTDIDLRTCMNSTGVGGTVPPNPSFYSYMLTRWNEWLYVNEDQALAECLGIDPANEAEKVPPIDLEWLELELDESAIAFVRRECVEITAECNICDWMPSTSG